MKNLVLSTALALSILAGKAATAETPEENKQVILDYYATYATGDMDALAAFFAEDIVWHIPGQHPLAGTKTGADEVLAFFRLLGRGSFRAELIALMADENWVIDMHRGWSNLEGQQNVDTIWVLAFRIEDGKIAEARNFSYDRAAADSFFWATYPLKPLPDRLADKGEME